MSDLTNRQQAIIRVEAISGDPDPQHPGGAWGERDEDHSQAEHDQANGVASNRQGGIGLPTAEETQTYYDSLRPTNIEIKE